MRRPRYMSGVRHLLCMLGFVWGWCVWMFAYDLIQETSSALHLPIVAGFLNASLVFALLTQAPLLGIATALFVYRKRRAHWILLSQFCILYGSIYAYVLLVTGDNLKSHNAMDKFGQLNLAMAVAVIAAPFTLVSFFFWRYIPRPDPPRFLPQCAICKYDLRGTPHIQRCPECGRLLEPGVDFPRNWPERNKPPASSPPNHST